uniref:uncharacterized protein n=1 Tax=Centroberyx gerrardi TaxID=166262 RepID=UPI003AAEF2E3
MFPFKTLVFSAALAALLAAVDSSSGGGGSRSFSFDLSNAADLRRLYNSAVYRAERMKRPLEGMGFELGPLSHSGVRVTLADGSQWLIHKGGKFGISSQTVVVDARHMSSDWRVVETKDFQGTKRVTDFVADGGADYSLIFDNCHLGAGRMMNN